MSRSFRKHPIWGITTCRSEKDDKRVDHRLQRARCRNLIAQERYDLAEVDGPGYGLWQRGKDGKQRQPWPMTLYQRTWRYIHTPTLEEERADWRKQMRK